MVSGLIRRTQLLRRCTYARSAGHALEGSGQSEFSAQNLAPENSILKSHWLDERCSGAGNQHSNGCTRGHALACPDQLF